MRQCLSSIFIIIIFTGISQAQEPDSSYFGGFFSYNFNFHNSDFVQLPGVPNCCPRFKEAEADGYSAGLFYEYAMPLNFSLSLRGGFNNIAGIFTVYEPTRVKVDGQLTDGEFKHYLNVKLADISINPTLNFRVYEGLSLHIGGHAGIFVQKEFNQYEEITKPAKQGVFADTETRRRNINSGKIDSVATVFGGLTAGISYRLPLNKSRSLWLVPEVFYMFGETDIIEKYKWTANSLKLGIALKYTDVYIKKAEQEKTIYKSDTVRKETTYPENAGFFKGNTNINYTNEENDDYIIKIKTISRTDTIFVYKSPKDTLPVKPKPELRIVSDKDNLTIKQDYATFYCPVLPDVFFDRDSPALPEYYTLLKDKNGYEPDYEPDDPQKIQKDLLNIIGNRMANKPEIKIKLRGYIDRSTEGNNCSLAVGRAETIKQYLVEKWGIEPERVSIVSSNWNCFPGIRTATQNEMGYADNRRVEIISDDMEIYEPVVIKTLVDLSNPGDTKIKINLKYNNTDSIAEWKFLVKNGSTVLINDEGSVMPSELTLDFKKISLKQKISNDFPITIETFVKEKDGTITYENKNIPINMKDADIETKRIAFVLFDVDKMILNRISESSLKSILSNIGSFSNLKITGFTDNFGDYSRNKRLSLLRAQTIGRIIERMKPLGINISINAAATDYYPFGVKSYGTQIERFLSRSVVVELF